MLKISIVFAAIGGHGSGMRRLALLGCLVSMGCFTGSAEPADSGTDSGTDQPDAAKPKDSGVGADVTTVTSETWSDGKSIGSTVLIPSGVTVTIAPAATITVAASAKIIVQGTLVGTSTAAHATLTGSNWGGIQITSHGVMTLTGVDLTGASIAVDAQADVLSTYDQGTISGATNPFSIAAGSSISTTHATVTAPQGITLVSGSFTASYLDYDANDQGAVVTLSPTASVHIDDSTIHNSGPMGKSSAPDLLTANGGTMFHVAYTDMSGAHCGFHFEGIDSVEVDHVTVHDVTNGADVWKSTSKGTRTVTSSNFESLSENLDEQGTNGTYSVTGCYLTGTNKLKTSSSVTISSSVLQPILDAKPH